MTEKIAASVRHNRIREAYRVYVMSESIPESICRDDVMKGGRQHGMVADEVQRLLRYLSGLVTLFRDESLSGGWTLDYSENAG